MFNKSSESKFIAAIATAPAPTPATVRIVKVPVKSGLIHRRDARRNRRSVRAL